MALLLTYKPNFRVALIINFAIFGTIKSHVNGDGSGSTAAYGAGTWTLLAAFIILFLYVPSHRSVLMLLTEIDAITVIVPRLRLALLV